MYKYFRSDLFIRFGLRAIYKPSCSKIFKFASTSSTGKSLESLTSRQQERKVREQRRKGLSWDISDKYYDKEFQNRKKLQERKTTRTSSKFQNTLKTGKRYGKKHQSTERIGTEDKLSARYKENSNEKIKYRRLKTDDAFKIAEIVQTNLSRDDEEGALFYATKGLKNSTVAWNYLMIYKFEKGSVSGALKYFSEMRRRGSVPNSHTYTVIFNGLAQNSSIESISQKCLNLLQILLEQNAVKPTVLHLNSALKVCSNIPSVSTMYEVIYAVEEKIKIDEISYCTMLTTLSRSSEKESEDYAQDAMTIWADIISRIAAKEIRMTERIALAFGRVMVKSKEPTNIYILLRIFSDVYGLPMFCLREDIPGRSDTTSARDEMLSNHLLRSDKKLKASEREMSLIAQACELLRQKEAYYDYVDHFRDKLHVEWKEKYKVRNKE
ncbi:hypothetical protein V1514DRAFT_331105 [Lipomyces japonicus]|uniref:uncharacterized protein n=1 Tax=Lipomyces japonicus TaxID=56871 RepID=UPI0034D0146E